MGIEIVFVHLGHMKASHLKSNIALIKATFPEIIINCVMSENSVLKAELPFYVNQFIYKPSIETDNLLNAKIKDSSFRNGFWRYTFERLIAINTVHISRPNSALIHVESDILLLPNFPFSSFKNLNKIHWLPVDSNKDAASLMYFPNARLTNDFINDLHEFLMSNENISDMLALRNLRYNFPSKYCLLPTTNPNFPKLENLELEYDIKDCSFAGIFDAAAIGMWLTGIDPRNGYGFTKYFATEKIIASNLFIDPSSYSIKFSQEQGMFFENQTSKLPIYNLHIHSKSKRIFSHKWETELKYLINYSYRNKPKNKFSTLVLMSLIKDNYLNRTLLEFLYNSPSFWILRKLNNKFNK